MNDFAQKSPTFMEGNSVARLSVTKDNINNKEKKQEIHAPNWSDGQ